MEGLNIEDANSDGAEFAPKTGMGIAYLQSCFGCSWLRAIMKWIYVLLYCTYEVIGYEAGAYLGFEITGANKKFSPVFFIDRFL